MNIKYFRRKDMLVYFETRLYSISSCVLTGDRITVGFGPKAIEGGYTDFRDCFIPYRQVEYIISKEGIEIEYHKIKHPLGEPNEAAVLDIKEELKKFYTDEV